MIRTVYREGKFIPIEPVPSGIVEGATYDFHVHPGDLDPSLEDIRQALAEMNELAMDAHPDDDRIIAEATRQVREADRRVGVRIPTIHE